MFVDEAHLIFVIGADQWPPPDQATCSVGLVKQVLHCAGHHHAYLDWFFSTTWHRMKILLFFLLYFLFRKTWFLNYLSLSTPAKTDCLPNYFFRPFLYVARRTDSSRSGQAFFCVYFSLRLHVVRDARHELTLDAGSIRSFVKILWLIWCSLSMWAIKSCHNLTAFTPFSSFLGR